jgi:tetratricopeptide (TPR) repeat protein
MNYIGYSYADRGIHLSRAEELIRAAILIKPDDGYITDSLGWVYFKMGNYEKALQYLEEAHARVPDDPVIMEHLADACLKMNNPERAIALLQKTLSLDPARTHARSKLDHLLSEYSAQLPPCAGTE